MPSILYGNLRVEIISNVGGRVERTSLRPAESRVALRQPWSTSSTPVLLLGRDEQLGEIRRAIQARHPIEFDATCGFGKSTLLRHVVASATGDGTARSWVYLQVGHDQVEDLLQRLVDELYTADQPVKLTPVECAQVLGQVQAVVVLDDVSLDPEQVTYLLGVLPGCSLVLSSTRPTLGRHGSSQTLAGLADDAALQLVTTDLGRPVSGQELPAVKRLAAAVEGQPLHLRQAAALVREDGHLFPSLARKAEHDPEVLDRLSLDALAEHERRALAVLALAAGALLPKELVAAMGDIAQIGECLSSLHRRGLADQRDDRFGLPACKVESYRGLLLKYLHLAAALRELGRWLAARDPTSGESASAAGAALAIVGFAAERGDWPAVVRLVRVVEPILTLAGRWEASRHLLDQGLQAAKATGNRAAEALFSHQQGVLALCQDELDAAKRLLEHALRLREELGDRNGAAVSRHNLQLLQPVAPPQPPSPPRRGLRRLVIAAGTVLALVIAGVLIGQPWSHSQPPTSTTGTSLLGGRVQLDPAALQFGQQQVGTTSPTHKLTIRNPGTGQLRLTAVGVEQGDQGDFHMTANHCRAPIGPGRSCSVGVTFSPTAIGRRAASLVVHLPDAQVLVSLGGTGVQAADRRAPTLKARDLVVEAASKDGATVRYTVTAVDDVDGRVPVDCQPGSGTVFPFGATRVNCTSSDRSGNTAHGSFSVTVRDSTGPTLSVPGDITVEATNPAGASVRFDQPTASDRIDGPLKASCSRTSGETFSLGTTKVTCEAADSHGNKGTASFAIIVRDTTRPTIGTHDNLEEWVSFNETSKIVTFDPPPAQDAVDQQVTVTCQPASGDSFKVGSTTVTCQAIDDSGNRSNPTQFTVTVNQAPG